MRWLCIETASVTLGCAIGAAFAWVLGDMRLFTPPAPWIAGAFLAGSTSNDLRRAFRELWPTGGAA